MRKVLGIAVSALFLLITAAGTATGAAAQPTKDIVGTSTHGAPTAPPPGVSPQSAGSRIVDATNGLGDEATLRKGGAYSNGNYAGLWQAILFADGFLPAHEVDCEFGPITHEATRAWQAHFGLANDGVVGVNTRTLASTWLYNSSDPNYNYYYYGYNERILLWRETWNPGNLWIWWGGQWTRLDYNAQTIPGC